MILSMNEEEQEYLQEVKNEFYTNNLEGSDFIHVVCKYPKYGFDFGFTYSSAKSGKFMQYSHKGGPIIKV